MRTSTVFGVLIAFALCAAAAQADPVKGASLDVFNGAATAPTAPAIVDMKAYCRAHLDIVATATFSGEFSIQGSSAAAGAPWFPIDVPAPNAIDARRGVFHVSGGQSTTSQTLMSLDFAVPQLYLMIAPVSVHSGQAGGTIQAILTAQPC